MPEVSVRPYVLASVVYLGVGVAVAAEDALFPDARLAPLAAWSLLVGWLALAWLGLASWYFPPFVKREVASARVAALPRWLAHGAAAALALGLAAGAAGASSAAYLALALAPRLTGLALLVGAGVLAWSAARGPAWRGGVPAWSRPGPYRAGDRLAAFLAALALVQMALAGVVALVGFALAPFAQLAGFAATGLAAFAAFLLPRNLKAPLAPAVAALAAAVAAVGVAGALALAAAPDAAWARAAAGLGLLGLAGALRAAGVAGVAGPLARGARPWFLAAALALLAAVAAGSLGPGAPSALLPALLLAGLGAAQAAVAVLAWPIVLNAAPAGAAWAGAGAALVALGVALLVLGVPLGVLALAAAAVAHLGQLAPLRVPRRECPPRMAPDA